MSDPDYKPMSEEEFRASVYDFVTELAEKSGVDIDAEEVWAELMARKVKLYDRTIDDVRNPG